MLEIAAGTGILTRALTAELPDAQIVATDLNPAMVAWGTAHVPGATWQVADAQHLDVGNGAFDVAACQFGVMFFPDRQSAFAQLRQSLRPGGALVFTTWDRIEFSTFAAALADSVDHVLGSDAPTFLTRMTARVHRRRPDRDRCPSRGFRRAANRASYPHRPGASVTAVAHGFCKGTPLRFELERRGALEPLAAAIAADMSARLGDGPVLGELAGYLVSVAA